MQDDGNVELEVLEADVAAKTVTAISLTDVPILERKGVNLPGVFVDLPHVTRKDELDIATAKALGADMLFASFVQSAEMVREIRRHAGPGIAIISKIENQSGIDNYDEILQESDGIMVARGDLGVQIPPERVFLAQKRLVARANLAVSSWLHANMCATTASKYSACLRATSLVVQTTHQSHLVSVMCDSRWDICGTPSGFHSGIRPDVSSCALLVLTTRTACIALKFTLPFARTCIAGQAHHLRHSNAGEHDGSPPPHPCRVRGRCERGAGRDGRRHAERGDSQGEVPTGGSGFHVPHLSSCGDGLLTPALLQRPLGTGRYRVPSTN